jgi:hypothetical protein
MKRFRIKEVKDRGELIIKYKIQQRWLLFFWTPYGEDVGACCVRVNIYRDKSKAEEYLKEVIEFENK